MFADIIFVAIGLTLILTGANYLTDGAAALAQRFRVPEFIIGLTIVAIGTSAPELVVSVLSAIANQSDVAVGNVVGSNIFNVLVILGICALICPIALSSSTIRRDIPIGLAASLLLVFLACDYTFGWGDKNTIGRFDGILMLLLYIGLIGYTIRAAGHTKSSSDENKHPQRSIWIVCIMIIGGLAGLIYGGELFLEGAIQLARSFGISESVIAITLVAGGTSMPELASSCVSLVRGKADIALGNVIGSNIANILLILGLSATINPLTLGGITLFDLGCVVLSSALIFLAAFTFRKKTIDRWEGAIFILIYIGYLWTLLK